MSGRTAAGLPGRDAGPPCRHCVVATQCPVAVRGEIDGTASAGGITARSFGRNVVLQREGERSAQVAFIKSGLLGIFQGEGQDRSCPIAVVGPGNLLGQSELLAQPALFTMRALTPVAVCEFSAELLAEAAALQGRSVPVLLLVNARMVVSTLADWGKLMRLPSLDQRFAQALKLIAAMQPSGATQLPAQGVLADLMCVTRESINRCWREFQARGLVRRRHRHGVDLDLEQIDKLLQPEP